MDNKRKGSSVRSKKISAYKCAICENDISVSTQKSLIITGVPENTFHISEKTVTLQIVNCKYCGATQLVNTPLSDDYNVVYRSIGVSEGYREEKRRQIEAFVKSYALMDKRIIEIGCGNGQFLQIFREIGAHIIVGVESGAENCRECTLHGFDVIQGDIVNIRGKNDIADDTFDAFVTFHFLEHLPNPVEFLHGVYRVIKPGGIGLIEVPNYDYIDKNSIWLEFTKDHRFYYRKRTLCYLLSKCGFDVELIEENNEGICLTATVRKPENDNDNFRSMKHQIKKDTEKFKDLIDSLDGSFAVYGAGHYSQLLMNIIYRKYGLRPLHIFDSNKKKCGYKISNVLVEHGDNIATLRDCDNIIVICGIYNDEICKALSGLNKNVIKWGS